MTKIDETTGLAQLPEDMFWRIEEAELRFGYTSVTTLRLLLMRKETRVTKARSVTDTEEVTNGFWRRLVTGEKVETVVTTTEYPEVAEELEWQCITRTMAHRSEAPKDIQRWTKYVIKDHYGYIDDKDMYFRLDEPTPENISALSVEVLNEWINDRHELALKYDRQVAIDRLTGDYPPKSLKDLVDS